MQEINQNFPSVVSSLSRMKLSDSVKDEITANQRMIPPGKSLMALNGALINIEDIDLYLLVDMVQQELLLADQFSKLKVPHSAIRKLLSTMSPPESNMLRVDFRSAHVLYLNNLEEDAMYKRWRSNINEILMPVFPGQLRYIRKNLFHAVYVLDPATSHGLECIDMIISLYENNFPMRFGLILYSSKFIKKIEDGGGDLHLSAVENDSQKEDTSSLEALMNAMNDELPRIQEQVYYGHINSRTDILDKFLSESSISRYNPQIIAEGKAKPRFVSLSSSVLEGESVINDISYLHSPNTIDDLKPVTQLLVVDITSIRGIKLLHEGILYLIRGSKAGRLGVIFSAKTDTDLPALLFMKAFEITVSSYRQLGLEAGVNAVITNGRVTVLTNEGTFLSHDLNLLESLEFKQRIKHIAEIIGEVQWQDIDPDVLTSKFVSDIVMSVSSAMALRDRSSESARFEILSAEHSAVIIENENSTVHIDAVVDPLSPVGQKVASLLRVLRQYIQPSMRIVLNPMSSLVDLPLKNFYRYVVPTMGTHNNWNSNLLKWAAGFIGGSGQAKKDENTSMEHGKGGRRGKPINIFSIASGHLYERFLKIMILSVLKNTNRPVKFWFIKNYLSPQFKDVIPRMAQEYGFEYELITYKWPSWLHKQKEKQRIIWAYKILFLDVIFPLSLEKVIFVDADQVVRADMGELYDMDIKGRPLAYTPFCDNNKDMDGYRFWRQGFWKEHLRGKPYHISALYVVDLVKFRETAAGDNLRVFYETLSKDPNSLSNLDQDLPNYAQHNVPIFSLPQEWLWCESWCGNATKSKAKTIDLCNNPMTKEPKLQGAKRIVSEWVDLDSEARQFTAKILGDEVSPQEPASPNASQNSATDSSSGEDEDRAEL
ncbi:hypothetical protein GH714_019555 [Hevea brasiliensis]|uniref:Glucosyltransferase 24 catalytic domain-containing protein n=1 Tax=Hevea brasiliensis TaxID=3981 RepID=A0A6A6N2F5_HEVBR|nr:hypothetical protein GH714_019555 [Hevea brasiliensis]